MYCEYFKFQEKPFSLAPASRLLYMSRQHWEAIAHLLYGVEDDWGFVLLTGEIGTGKTTMCRFLLEQMPGDVEVALIVNPKLTTEELLATICDEFRISYPEGNKSVKVFVDPINAFLLDAHAKARKSLLIIDEAQCLSSEVLDQLRLLTNLETDQSKLLRIILIGQPELRDKLSKPELQQMAQRITARYHIGPLSKNEVSEYVKHRLKASGSQKNLFPDKTIKELYHLSSGVPRLINAICDRALLGAYLKKQSRVDRSTLDSAAKEVFSDTSLIKNRDKWFLIKCGIAVLLLCAAIALIYNNQILLRDLYNGSVPENKEFMAEPSPSQAIISRLSDGQSASLAMQKGKKDRLKQKTFIRSSFSDYTFSPEAKPPDLQWLYAADRSHVFGPLLLPLAADFPDSEGTRFHETLITLKREVE